MGLAGPRETPEQDHQPGRAGEAARRGQQVVYRRLEGTVGMTVKKEKKSPVLWIRIRNGLVFRSFVDPDQYWEYRSGSTHENIGWNKI